MIEQRRRSRIFAWVSMMALAAAAIALAFGPTMRAARATPDGDQRSAEGREEFDFSIWQDVPIQEGGLEKSFYTFARDYVREAAGKASWGGRDPIENVFSMALQPELWLEEKILKARHKELKKLFPDAKHGRISYLELEDKRAEWAKLAATDKGVEKELNRLLHQSSLIFDFRSVERLRSSVNEALLIVPVADFRGEKTEWRTVDDLRSRTKDKSPAEEKLIASFTEARAAFLAADAERFNSASTDAVSAISSLGVPTFKPAWKFRLDRWDGRLGLFRVSGWIYLLAALAFLVSYLAGRKMFVVFAASTLGLGAAINVGALVVRGILAERTPVANLFESGVFIIAVLAVFSLVISIYYKTRLVGLAGASMGAFFMGVANNIPAHYGGKITPLIDALQSYWLRIHVTSMLVSYAFLSVAFAVAAAYFVRAMWMRGRPGFNPAEDSTLKYLDSLNFRVITITMPILTAGVILGAVWAAEAWGRPWAFDPKETAILITWMVYALYLHCRLFLGWRGMRGIMLSMLGFAAVVFTYLGVSFFLPGLHSYVSSESVSFTEFLKNIIPGI